MSHQGWVTFLDLLVTVFLMQPRVLLSFFTSRDIAGSCQSWCPPGPPHPSLQRCLWIRWPLAFSGAWGFSSPEQDFTLSLVKLHKVPDSPFLLPGEVPLDVSTTFWCTWCSPSFVPAPSLGLSHSQSLLWSVTVPWCELTAAVRLLLQQLQPGLSLLLVVLWAPRGQGRNLVYILFYK